MQSIKITCKTKLQYGNCQSFWILIAKMIFQQYKSQKWIQHPWIMWNWGITLASETKSTKVTRNGNFQYGHWQPSWISVANITFKPCKSQKWIQCPWIIWNKGVILASETKSTKITRNGNVQYGHWQPSWTSVENMISQRGSISYMEEYIEKYQCTKFHDFTIKCRIGLSICSTINNTHQIRET